MSVDRPACSPQDPASDRRTGSLSEIAALFLRLGTTAFGGPAAHIAMMEEEIVRRRRWLSREQFLDYLGATNLIPGPNSTELALHIGRARNGWPGFFVAGLCFIMPAAVIVGIVAWAYDRYGNLPEVAGLLYGVKPVVIAIVAQALWHLCRTAVKSTGLAVLTLLAVVAVLAGIHELVVLVAAGIVSGLSSSRVRSRRGAAGGIVALGGSTVSIGLAVASVTGSAASAAVPFSLWYLFAVFVKIGAVLFGSGYVLLAFLRADLVERLGWLSEQQLLDAVAVGQVTPGPVFTTATFIGYILGGPMAAGVATIGIFLPAFVFVALSGPLVPRMRRSRVVGAALDGVNVASLALMAVVTWQLGRATFAGILPIGLALVSLGVLLRYSVNTTWLIAAEAVLGWLATLQARP